MVPVAYWAGVVQLDKFSGEIPISPIAQQILKHFFFIRPIKYVKQVNLTNNLLGIIAKSAQTGPNCENLTDQLFDFVGSNLKILKIVILNNLKIKKR